MVIVTRQDLSPGYQAVQPAHALADFATTHTREFHRWHKLHKNLVILAVPDEASLRALYDVVTARGIKSCLFEEPDINNEATALAIEPGEMTYKLTSSLPLALKKYAGVHSNMVEV